MELLDIRDWTVQSEINTQIEVGDKKGHKYEPWIRTNKVSLKSQGSNHGTEWYRLSCLLRRDVRDVDHDRCKALMIPLIGLKFETYHEDFHLFRAFIHPSSQEVCPIRVYKENPLEDFEFDEESTFPYTPPEIDEPQDLEGRPIEIRVYP